DVEIGLWLGVALGAIAAAIVFVPNLRRPKAAKGAVQTNRLTLTATSAIVAVLVVSLDPRWWLLLTPVVFGVVAAILRSLDLQHGSRNGVVISWILVGFVAALFWFWVQQAFDRGPGGDAGSAGLFVVAAALVVIATFVVIAAAMRLLLDPLRNHVPAALVVGGGAVLSLLLAGFVTWLVFWSKSSWYREH